MTRPTVVLDGLAMGESPRWRDDRLWVCDWAAHELLTVDADGHRDVVATVPWFPFCIDWLPDATLLVVAGDEASVQRRSPDGSFAAYADLRALSPHPWNEVVTTASGHAYVNGIGFDLASGEPPAPGLLAVVSPDGRARTVAEDLAFPNGMAVTVDGTTLL